MKTIYTLLTFALLLAAQLSQAQFVFGFKAGAVATNFTKKAEETQAYYPNITMGFVGELPISKSLLVSSELTYLRSGAINKETDDLMEIEYLSIPILIQRNINNLYIKVGPDFNFLLASNVNGIAADEVFKTLNLGFSSSFGYRAPKGFNVELRQVIGMTNISPILNTKTLMYMLTVGYFLDTKK